MTTPSHLIMTAALSKGLRCRMPTILSAVLLGSITPDIPLFLLSTGTALYYVSQGQAMTDMHDFMFDDLFFNSPWWIVPHNLFHAPLLLLFGLMLAWPFRRRLDSVGRWLFWFLAAALLHTFVDILTHTSDGPLLLFPFDWTVRFHSPVSYWEPKYYGSQFFIFEIGLNILLLSYLCRERLKRWFVRTTMKSN